VVIVLKARFGNRREAVRCASEHAVWGTTHAIMCESGGESSGICDEDEKFILDSGSSRPAGFALLTLLARRNDDPALVNRCRLRSFLAWKCKA
jgi:hypothetical protein